MKDVFYRPDLKPNREYRSDATFEDKEKIIVIDGVETPVGAEDLPSSTSEVEESLKEIVDGIKKIEKILDILPPGLKDPIKETLDIIVKDIINPPPAPPVPVAPPSVPDNEREPGISNPEPVENPGANRFPSIAPDPNKGIKRRVSLMPRDSAIEIELEEAPPLAEYILNSFTIDKRDIYKDFVDRLKLMIQQYMRELLYVAKLGEFPSYLNLFNDYDISSASLPNSLKPASDRIIRSQVRRDQRTRMFKKVYNIEQTMYHMRANRASYELRQRYYATNYLAAKDYLEVQENDELRRSRNEYDKKYEDNMYNFYKYLNSSVLLTDEILKTFLSEARAKAILNRNGIDIDEGTKAKEAKKEAVTKKNEEKSKKEQEKHNTESAKRAKELAQAGKDSSYSGSYGDKSGIGSTAADGLPTSAGGASTVADIAVNYVKTRGAGSSNPVIYSQTLRAADMEMKKYADCSSFARRVLLDAGKPDPGGYTKAQLENDKGQWIEKLSDLQPGDLMFFSNNNPNYTNAHSTTLPNGKKTTVAHVGVYVGGTVFVECTSSKGIVSSDFGTSNWHKSYVSNHFIGARRF